MTWLEIALLVIVAGVFAPVWVPLAMVAFVFAAAVVAYVVGMVGMIAALAALIVAAPFVALARLCGWKPNWTTEVNVKRRKK